MNYLAHTFLSKPHIDFQLGNILADPLKGQAWQGASHEHRAGLHMHSAIDLFTDRHPIVHRSKARLAQRGHLRGVVIDVVYDHFLCKHWDRFSQQSLGDYLHGFHNTAAQATTKLPGPAQDFIQRLIQSNLLASYRNFDHLAYTFARIDQRLSARTLQRESSSAYYAQLKHAYVDIEQDFLEFFPQLCEMTQQQALK